MWSLNFLIEVAVKFGVLLAVSRNEVEKKPKKPCKLFSSDMCFQSIKNIEKENE